MAEPKEPKPDRNPDHLERTFRTKLELALCALRSKGFNPVLVEGRRSQGRQSWLYGVGRWHHKRRRPVTWTMESRHLKGKAADIIEARDGYDNNWFFVQLGLCCQSEGLRTLPHDRCHVEEAY